MIIRPAGISVVLSPCGASPALPQLDLRVLGTTGITFGAVVDAGPAREQNAPQDIASLPQIESAVPWQVRDVPWISSAVSPAATVPSTITLSIDPSSATSFNQAHVTVVGQLEGQTYTRISNIAFVCTDNPVYLPVVSRMAWPRLVAGSGCHQYETHHADDADDQHDVEHAGVAVFLLVHDAFVVGYRAVYCTQYRVVMFIR